MYFGFTVIDSKSQILQSKICQKSQLETQEMSNSIFVKSQKHRIWKRRVDEIDLVMIWFNFYFSYFKTLKYFVLINLKNLMIYRNQQLSRFHQLASMKDTCRINFMCYS